MKTCSCLATFTLLCSLFCCGLHGQEVAQVPSPAQIPLTAPDAANPALDAFSAADKTPGQKRREALQLELRRAKYGDFSLEIAGVPYWWGNNEEGYIQYLKSTIAHQQKVISSAGKQNRARQNAGILRPVFSVAESVSAPWFYWLAFGSMVAGLAWFLIRLLRTAYELNLRDLSYKPALRYVPGILICLIGLLFTTQAAVHNSVFAQSNVSVLSAGLLGIVAGFVAFRKGGVVLSEADPADEVEIEKPFELGSLADPAAALAMKDVKQQEHVQITAEALDIRSEDLEEMETGAAVDVLVEGAARMNASDLFFLSEHAAVTVSVRRFGKIMPIAVLPPLMGRRAIGHVKAMAGMDISEHRRPLDGRWVYSSDDFRIDMRVNTTPTLYGEDMALRIWNRMSGLLTLDELGMSPHDLGILKAMLNEPSGLILVTGPTGAGKTTTLYACLQHLSNGTRKLNTIEDPVEFILPGVRQSQVNETIGIDFPDLLRSVFRQAPDVIMIGEIRDSQTATTAVRAANSGHLVLATLHSPTASGAVQSMHAFGIEPFFLSTSLLGSVAQRLVRTLCPKCRTFVDLGESPQTFEDIRDMLDEGEGRGIYAPGKCDECHSSGYLGRTGLFEVIKVRKQIRDAIANGASSREIERVAITNGMTEFRRAALLKVAKGITSTEDIMRDIPAEQLGLDD